MASAFFFTAPPGPGLDPDALSYLGAARALVSDGALRIPVAPWWSDSTTQPLTHFPPGYSATLAAPIAIGFDARLAARIVQAVAAGLTTVVLMLTLWPVAGAGGAVLGMLAMALSPAYVMVHLSVLSEPLFLAFVMCALWSFARRPRNAWLHGLIAAAATMVRYAGLSVAGAAALWALRDTAASWRDRLRRASIAMAPSVLAMAAWSLTRARAPGRAASIRKFAVYGNWLPTLQEGARSVGHFLAPSLEWVPVPWLAAVATGVALAALSWNAARVPGDAARDARHEDQQTLLMAAGVIALSYVALVVASRALADPMIPFDFRITVPLVPLAIVAVVVTAVRAWPQISRAARTCGALALLVWGAAAAQANYEQVQYALTEGSDFASREWRNSPTLAWARAQGSRELYTNWPSAIWFHLDRRVRDVPAALDAATLRAFTARMRATHGAMVTWNVQNPETAHTDSIIARAGLVRVAVFDDGAAYEAPALASPSPSGSSPASPLATPLLAPSPAHR